VEDNSEEHVYALGQRAPQSIQDGDRGSRERPERRSASDLTHRSAVRQEVQQVQQEADFPHAEIRERDAISAIPRGTRRHQDRQHRYVCANSIFFCLSLYLPAFLLFKFTKKLFAVAVYTAPCFPFTSNALSINVFHKMSFSLHSQTNSRGWAVAQKSDRFTRVATLSCEELTSVELTLLVSCVI